MTGDELASALERCEIPNEGFSHASHLGVAWTYLTKCTSVEEAVGRMVATLRRFAASVGKSENYHETITIFWMRLLAAARAARPGASLDEVLRDYPGLLDKDLPLAYYSPGRLNSDTARLSWREPDLRRLILDVTSPRSADSSRDPSNRPVSR